MSPDNARGPAPDPDSGESRATRTIEALRLVGSFDYALPQHWVDRVLELRGESPAGACVWYYPSDGPCSIGGYPLATSARGVRLLGGLAIEAATPR